MENILIIYDVRCNKPFFPRSGADQTIFDTAQCEVEERMTRTTYRNFLTSDMYLAYIQVRVHCSASISIITLHCKL